MILLELSTRIVKTIKVEEIPIELLLIIKCYTNPLEFLAPLPIISYRNGPDSIENSPRLMLRTNLLIYTVIIGENCNI